MKILQYSTIIQYIHLLLVQVTLIQHFLHVVHHPVMCVYV